MKYQKIPRFVLIMVNPRQRPRSGTRPGLSRLVPSVATQQTSIKAPPNQVQVLYESEPLVRSTGRKLPISEED